MNNIKFIHRILLFIFEGRFDLHGKIRLETKDRNMEEI